MSYDHRTEGHEQFNAFLRGLRTMRPTITVEVVELETTVDIGGQYGDGGHLRKATFRHPQCGRMVVEEYLSVDDHDCDGISRIAIEVYREGQRPDLEARTRVIQP